MKYKTIEIEIKKHVETIWLNRPEIHNAFNGDMISEITEAIKYANDEEGIRVVVIRGRGESFCAGADLNWFSELAKQSHEENYQANLKLSECFYEIYTCKKPTIAMVHGAAIGGANGLLAACDFAYAEENTVFSLSEIEIGIIPASIAPYVIKRIGEFKAKALMLTGRRFKGRLARKRDLINKSIPSYKFEEELDKLIKQLKVSSNTATKYCKNLIYDASNTLSFKETVPYTAKMFAEIIASDEVQKGISAFLEKRKA